MTGILVAIVLNLTPNAPSLDLFGHGPVTNLSSEQAWTNAAAHLWFGIACPLALSRWTSLKTWKAGVVCGAVVLTRETFWHGRTSGPEVRTDLLSNLLPILSVVIVDALVHP